MSCIFMCTLFNEIAGVIERNAVVIYIAQRMISLRLWQLQVPWPLRTVTTTFFGAPP